MIDDDFLLFFSFKLHLGINRRTRELNKNNIYQSTLIEFQTKALSL